MTRYTCKNILHIHLENMESALSYGVRDIPFSLFMFVNKKNKVLQNDDSKSETDYSEVCTRKHGIQASHNWRVRLAHRLLVIASRARNRYRAVCKLSLTVSPQTIRSLL